MQIAGGVLAAMWLIYFINLVFQLKLNRFGIIPRNLWGLIGIFSAPLLHANLGHLVANTFPFIILSAVLAMAYYKKFDQIFWSVWFLNGALVWVLARSANHIGCSGVIYGLAGVVMALGIFQKRLWPLLISIIVTGFYGLSMLTGLFRFDSGISWESHLLGFFSGVFLAWFYRRKKLY